MVGEGQTVSVRRLEDLRARLSLSWRELAAQLGVGETMLHYLRTGQRRASPKLHRRVCELERQCAGNLLGNVCETGAEWQANRPPDERLAAVLAEMDDGQLRGTLASAIDHCNATAIEIVAGELAARARRDQGKEGGSP